MSGNPTLLTDKMLGNAYEVVRLVAYNVEYVKHVSAHMAEIYRVSGSVDGIDAILLEIAKIDTVMANLTDIVTVSDNIDNVNGVGNNITQLMAIHAELAKLVEIYNNLDGLLALDGPGLVARLDALEATDVTQGTRFTSIETAITDLQAVDTALTTRITANENTLVDHGARITTNETDILNRIGRVTNERLFSNYENGVVQTSIANAWSAVEERPLISGASLEVLAQLQNRLDHATRYAGMFTPLPMATIAGAGTTYTATGVAFTTALTAAQAALTEPGTYLRTSHSPPWLAQVTSIAADRLSITVAEWRREDGVGAAGTPANETGLVVGAADQVYGDNLNLHTTDLSLVRKGVIAEWGIFHEQTTAGGTQTYKGLDIVNFGPSKAEFGYTLRGKWDVGYRAHDVSVYGFLIDASGNFNMARPAWLTGTGDVPLAPAQGFVVNTQGTELPFRAANNGTTYWYIYNGGASRFGVESGAWLDITPRADPTGTVEIAARGANTTANLGLYAKGGGILQIGTGTNAIGFFGGSGTTKQTVGGSRANTEQALLNLLNVMQAYGLITNSTTT